MQNWDVKIARGIFLTFLIYGIASTNTSGGKFIPPVILNGVVIAFLSLAYFILSPKGIGKWMLFFYTVFAFAEMLSSELTFALLDLYKFNSTLNWIQNNESLFSNTTLFSGVIYLILFAGVSALNFQKEKRKDLKFLNGCILFITLLIFIFGYTLEYKFLTISTLALGMVAGLILGRNEKLDKDAGLKRFYIILVLTVMIDVMKILSLLL